MHESAEGTNPIMSEEQPAFSAPSDSGPVDKVSPLICLRTVRIWFPHNGLQLKEDIISKGLEDVIWDAIPLQELGAQHQARHGYGNRNDASLVEFAVLETGVPRVLEKYEIPNFLPLSSDDPMVLQQPVKDLESKKALCYQSLHSKYLQGYKKRQQLTGTLGYEMHKSLSDWYDGCLEDIGNRLKKLGYC
ncbi:hypothetical protein N7495_007417 [Penicillium taxi]|uniref:uncharacterized protein n=1 Tax=Penicillium taxi TaxID=168475 RepID=UPI0025454D6C|nr:uncharacterized protein N7495_007417 [Penicillium taxi]KAJ5887376.1 hypothetical protein N7495_007417 [Penicillium taxi]